MVRTCVAAHSIDALGDTDGMGPDPSSDGEVDVASGSALEAAGRARHAAGDHRGALEFYEAAFGRYRETGDLGSAARAAR
ncbi:MAG: hypothetical protein M3N32_09630, partial [Actinomycetota bacterium]|nr:hypothetical protein [Actinomycetota bacterium]